MLQLVIQLAAAVFIASVVTFVFVGVADTADNDASATAVAVAFDVIIYENISTLLLLLFCN